MYLEIVTPEASILSGEVQSVTVPGVQGEFQMLKNHAAIISVLEEGKVKFRGNPTIAEEYQSQFHKEGDKWHFHIKGGTVECKNNKVIILAD